MKRAIPILIALCLLPVWAGAEWRQVQQGDTTLCVSDTGEVARCSVDEKTGKLLIESPILTKQGRCPT